MALEFGAPAPAERLIDSFKNRRRLEAEAIRDSVLVAAGTLNPQVGGRSVKVPLEPEVYDLIFTEGEPDGLWPVTPDATQHTRRSIYLFNKRNVRLPMLESLDQPDTLNSCAVRPVSTFAPQALILMNGPFAQEQGKALAVKLAKEAGATPWTLAPHVARFWARGMQGSALGLTRTGPKDVHVTLVGLPLVRIPYFRNAYRGLAAGMGELFCRKCFVQEMSTGASSTSRTFRVQWA